MHHLRSVLASAACLFRGLDGYSHTSVTNWDMAVSTNLYHCNSEFLLLPDCFFSLKLCSDPQSVFLGFCVTLSCGQLASHPISKVVLGQLLAGWKELGLCVGDEIVNLALSSAERFVCWVLLRISSFLCLSLWGGSEQSVPSAASVLYTLWLCSIALLTFLNTVA